MRRQIGFHESEAGIRGTVIHRRIVGLHSLGDGRAQLLAVLRSPDPLAFDSIGEEAGLQQDRGHADVSKDLEASVAHPAIKGRDVRQERRVDRGS